MFSNTECEVLVTASWGAQAHKSIPVLISQCLLNTLKMERAVKQKLHNKPPAAAHPLKILVVTLF